MSEEIEPYELGEYKMLTSHASQRIREILSTCSQIKQDDKHHPEIYVLQHLFQTFKWAIRETIDIDLILAALLHDVGKSIDNHNHVQESIKLIEDFSSTKTIWLVENHMRIWDYILGTMYKLKKCTDLIENPWLPELVQLARWDKKARSKGYIYYSWEDIDAILLDKTKRHFKTIGE